MDIETLCRAVMIGVVDSGAVTSANLDRAVAVIRAEVKALLHGAEYAPERAAVIAGTVHQGYVIRSVVSSCIGKL